jgi:predicted porin
MYKKISMLSIAIATTTVVFAEPQLYGNLNININQEDNANSIYQDSGEYYISSYNSILGVSGRENIRNNDLLNQVQYQFELGMDITSDDQPVFLEKAMIGANMPLGALKIGKQISIQNDLLLRSMDVFNVPRMIAAEESGRIEKITDNTIRFDSEIAGNYFGVASQLNGNEDSDYSVGIAHRATDYRVGVSYWTDNSTDETLSYYGINGTYQYGAWAFSGTYIVPNNNTLSNSYDLAIAGRISETIKLKGRYGELDSQWSMYGLGVEGKLSNSSIWYIEYQNKEYNESLNIDPESILAVGLNYEF